MKRALRHIAREWEKALFWLCMVALVCILASYLMGLLGDEEEGTPSGQTSKVLAPLLNEKTAFAFLDGLPEMAAKGSNPFAFIAKVPERAKPEERERKPWVRPPQTPKPEPPKPEPPKPAAVAKPVPPPTPAPVAAPTPPKPEPPPKPKHFVSLLYRGIYSSGEVEEGRRLAFLSSNDSETKKTSFLVLEEGRSFAGITIDKVAPGSLTVTGPDGSQRTLELGTQQKIFLE
ncbi:MAG: hypothetical protein JXR77_03610 [Lentisphaeria bacterium]|nr:hypothetical protein [Lentisphaeria bacterium]